MKLEQQVCSLELAKKLKELGMKQESVFYYLEGYTEETGKPSIFFDLDANTRKRETVRISAFTVAEIGEMLPKVIQLSHDNCYLVQSYANMNSKGENGHWCIAYESYVTHQFTGKVISQEKEADARAKMLIYLLENKLISLPDKEEVGE